MLFFHFFFFFFFNDTATTEIYTLSLHDALPICHPAVELRLGCEVTSVSRDDEGVTAELRETGIGAASTVRSQDRKSTRLNSSHLVISYAVFCLKKKKKKSMKIYFLILSCRVIDD